MLQIRLQSFFVALFLLIFAVACTPSEGANLKGTRWTLTSYGPVGAPVAPLPGTEITLEFEDSRSLNGSGSCNGYSGSYETKDTAITVSELFSTEMACVEAGVMGQEQLFLAALSEVTDFTYTAVELRLTYPGGVLVFGPEAPAVTLPLLNTEWELTTFEDGQTAHSLIADSMISAQFDGTYMTGHAGCNSYSAAYTRDGEDIEITDIVSTTMICAEAGVMAQETEFFEGLRKVKTVTITEARLTLSYRRGALHFRVAP